MTGCDCASHVCARCCWQPTGDGPVRDQLHEHAADSGHPLCLICHRSLPDDQPQTCSRCLGRTQSLLSGIRTMFDELPQHLRTVSSGSWGLGGRGGGDGRPLPGGDVLALMGRGSEGLAETGETSKTSDPTSVAYELGWWANTWAEVRRDPPPVADDWPAGRQVRAAASYLARHDRWAASSHNGFDDYAHDLRRLHGRLEVATGRSGRRAVAEAECFDCGGDLERQLDEETGYADHWTCQRCAARYDWPRYLLALRAHLSAHPAQGWSLPEHVALTLDASAKTIRSWAHRGVVAAACLVGDRRVRVWFPEVAEQVERRREVERRRAERQQDRIERSA